MCLQVAGLEKAIQANIHFNMLFRRVQSAN